MMGTKRPSWTLFDTLTNPNAADRKHQPGGRISRETSPRPRATAQSEREREKSREEECRREREMDRMKDKIRNLGIVTEPRERYSERDQAPALRAREGEREWRERGRRQKDERGRNGRPVSNLESGIDGEMERGKMKGGTFPRMRKDGKERDGRMIPLTEERGAKGPMERQKRIDFDDRERAWRRERQGEGERYRERERERFADKAREAGETNGGRPAEDGAVRRRDRPRESDPASRERRRRRERDLDIGGPRDRREKDMARERERPGPGVREREGRMPSPPRRRDGDIYGDRGAGARAERRAGKRDTRSEGDSDGGAAKESARGGVREEFRQRHSRSEGDDKDKTGREKERDRPRYREEPRYREGDRERKGDRPRAWGDGRDRGVEKDRDVYRERDRRKDPEFDQGGRSWRDGMVDMKGYRPDDRRGPSDRSEGERYREGPEEERRRRERKERESAPRRAPPPPPPPPRGQSSGEWSSDADGDKRRRRERDSYEERESGRESAAEGEREGEREGDRSRGGGGGRDRSEKPDRDRNRGEEKLSCVPDRSRMWLEPHRRKCEGRGRCSKDSSLEEEYTERERHTRRKERRTGEERTMGPGTERDREDRTESAERLRETGSRGMGDAYAVPGEGVERETEGVSVDGEEVSRARRRRDGGTEEPPSDSDDGGTGGDGPRDAERESVTDNTEESDREEGGGSDSESEGGSETGWERGRDRKLSGEDGFITVSSGGDWEDEREEEEFVDCRDFWEGGVTRDAVEPVGVEGHEGDRERQERWRDGKEQRFDEEGENREGQGKEKRPKYVFCVIGQTLPRSTPTKISEVDQREEVATESPSSESSQNGGDDVTRQCRNDLHPVPSRTEEIPVNDNREAETERERSESNMPREQRPHPGETSGVDVGNRITSGVEEKETGDEVKSKVEHPYAEIGPTNRDSQTERLLTEWRERNKDRKEPTESERGRLSSSPINPYGDVGLHGNSVPNQITPDGINPETMTPEEEVAIRIRMSGAWSMEEEAKRHSQAPHLKWAKNVVREILGCSEERTIDDPNSRSRQGQEVNRPESVPDKEEQEEEVTEGVGEMPVYAVVQKPRTDNHNSGADDGEAEPLEPEELRGMGQSQADMHADQFTAMHGDTSTYTHGDTLLDTDREEVAHSPPMDTKTDLSGHQKVEKETGDIGDVVNVDVIGEESGDESQVTGVDEEMSREKEVEMYLSVSKTLYKPNSCPSLNYDIESDFHIPATEVKGQEEEEEEEKMGESEEEKMGESEEERQGEEPEESGTGEEVKEGSCAEGSEEVGREGGEPVKTSVRGGVLKSNCSFRDLGPEVRIRRRGIRKTTERRKEELVEEEEEDEGVGRDRRTRIFTEPDPDCRSESWGEVDLRSVLDTIGRRKRNSKFFNAAQLYQQYSEAAQNNEILRQSRSDVVSTCEEHQVAVIEPLPSSSPAPSPQPARRPLPPLPTVPHPHSLSHSSSISNTSAKNLSLPEPPKVEGRPSSPRLSVSLSTQSATLWQDLPGVRNSTELEELTEDQRRLQEVRFEVVTSEASYCRSLDIVVEHFVMSKQLGALLTTQDRNWLFSRLADVRAISHSFLSKLEERVESDIIHFTVCDIIARHCKRFKMVYVPYLTNQSYQDATYQRLMDENPGFKRIVEKLERSPVCQRLPLRSFLILPFQRITRIKLLVQNIVKRTAPGNENVIQAIEALRLLEKLIQESNDSISQMKSIESLVCLSAKVDFECRTLPLISQSRRLVREGPVTELMDFSLKDTERNVYLHLFNDYLLLSLHKEGGRFTVIDHAPVSDLRAENCRVKLHSLQKNLFRLHLLNKALLLRTDTQSDKLRWISAVSRPHPEVDFSAAQDFTQMQCIRAFIAQQPDELSLEKADIILVHQQSSDGWVEGTRLSDRHRGWMPEAHLETITNSRVLQRNLSDALKLTTATAAL